MNNAVSDRMRAVIPRRFRAGLVLVALAGTWGAASEALAESAFLLPWPANMGRVPATTYDDHGAPLGDANLLIDQLDNGSVRVFSQSGDDHGAHTIATAELTPVQPGETLRLARQESHSFDPHGNSIGSLAIDHQARTARCLDANGALEAEVALDAEDRVVNVPLNLLFMPLVRGETSELHFQLFLCRNGARLVDFQAWVAAHATGAAPAPVEIRYAPDLGLFSPLAGQLVPRLSFWFDPRAPHGWIAHRLPLYTGGPEVLVVKQGISSASLAN